MIYNDIYMLYNIYLIISDIENLPSKKFRSNV